MSFLSREWSDGEKWAMGIASALLVAAILGIPRMMEGDVTLAVASKRDNYGRCLDAELFLANETKSDAIELKISFDVDYFTREGSVAVQYGDERDQLIAPGQRTLLPRRPYVPIAYKLDQESSLISIPRLRPGEHIHIFFGGEALLDANRASARERLLLNRESALMDKPRVISAVRQDGKVYVRRVVTCD